MPYYGCKKVFISHKGDRYYRLNLKSKSIQFIKLFQRKNLAALREGEAITIVYDIHNKQRKI